MKATACSLPLRPLGYEILDANSEQIGVCEDITPLEALADVTAVYEIQKNESVFGYARGSLSHGL